jgi:alpha-galactosidase
MVYLPQWRYGPAGPSAEFKQPIYALDPSHPKTLEFLRKVFQTYREWGVRYYMIDFLAAGADTLNAIPHAKHFDKKLVSGPEVYRKGLQTIREACGDDTHLLAATGPTIQTAGYMDSVRTGNDFGEGRPLNPLFDAYPGTFAINSPGHWTGPHHALANQASTYYTHRRLYINNSGNLLTVDKPLALNQAQVYATIHVMSGGPSMLGDDITFIDEERLSLIKKTLPRPKDVAFPVDLFSKREQAYPRVFHRQVVQPWGSYDVVAVYNLEAEQSIQQDIELKSLGLDESRSYLLWEFWNTDFVGKIRDRLSTQVPPYSVKVYRLAEDTGRPVILGTDMHMLMGEMEIDRCEWDAGQKTFSGRAIRPPGERGSVFIYAPPKMGVANPKGYYLGHDARDNSLIIRCHLEFEEGWASWNIKFFDL